MTQFHLSYVLGILSVYYTFANAIYIDVVEMSSANCSGTADIISVYKLPDTKENNQTLCIGNVQTELSSSNNMKDAIYHLRQKHQHNLLPGPRVESQFYSDETCTKYGSVFASVPADGVCRQYVGAGLMASIEGDQALFSRCSRDKTLWRPVNTCLYRSDINVYEVLTIVPSPLSVPSPSSVSVPVTVDEIITGNSEKPSTGEKTVLSMHTTLISVVAIVTFATTLLI